MLIDDVEILAVLNQPVRIENLADDAVRFLCLRGKKLLIKELHLASGSGEADADEDSSGMEDTVGAASGSC